MTEQELRRCPYCDVPLTHSHGVPTWWKCTRCGLNVKPEQTFNMKLIERVRREEREACARIVETCGHWADESEGRAIADAVRHGADDCNSWDKGDKLVKVKLVEVEP